MWLEVPESDLSAEHIVKCNVLLGGQCLSRWLNRRIWWWWRINTAGVVVEGIDVSQLHVTDTNQWLNNSTVVVGRHPPRFIEFVTLILEDVLCFTDVVIAKV
ncbi:MAG TPA: hypothetical protein DEF45_01765 [Rhodopirellula sp.]|nr:hypothetical protein [Rhodopirellula sp.]